MKNALASEKRRQAKLARHKSKSLERQRAYRARQKESPVSRTDDIAHIDAQAAEIIALREGLIGAYQEFHSKIAAQVEKILREADVWDTVQALETGREARRQADQEKVNQLNVKLEELGKVKGFLLERQAAEAVAPAPVLEVDAPVSEGESANGEAAPAPPPKASKKDARTASR